MYVGLKEMFTPDKKCVKYWLVFPAMTAYIILAVVIRRGEITIQESFGISDIIVVLFVGLTEELVFRGWLLNSTLKIGENKALAVNAAMFLMIHFPKWIYEGVFESNFVTFGLVSIIATEETACSRNVR